MAAGVALEALEVPIEERFRLIAAIVFVVLASLAAVQAWVGWYRTERAIRHQQPLRGTGLGLLLIIGILIGIGLIAIGAIWGI